MQSEDNKALPEKSKKRRFKTPSQVEALEKFYSEHKYPSEEVKAQIAESIGLTEKQISGWFCHRRLKDKKLEGESAANGRQDRSSVIVQDHVSGQRQDSCGSTKQVDNKNCDPREVESKRFLGREFSAPDLVYEHGNPQNGNSSDTSSRSCLPLSRGFHNQNEHPLDMITSRHLLLKDNFAATNSMAIRNRIGPSGYLKVKGQFENAAITVVKRQLGRQYLEDGPPLGVVFDPLPPGAFDSSTRDPGNEPSDLGDPDLHHNADFPRICNQPNSGMRYEINDSKTSLHDSEFNGASFKSTRASYHQNHNNPFSGWNSSIENEGSASEMSVYGSRKPKHSVEGRRMASASSHSQIPYVRQEMNSRMHNSYYASSEDTHKEHINSKNPILTLKTSVTYPLEVYKYHGERKAFNEHCISASPMIRPINEMRYLKASEFPQQLCARKASMSSAPLKRSTVELPASFNEDETSCSET